MWPRALYCALLGLGTLLANPIDDKVENGRQTRQVEPTMECCPCPGSKGFDELALAAAVGRNAQRGVTFDDDCPCRPRSVDSDTSPSILFPKAVRANDPPLTSFPNKDEPKPLLSPEVKFASSVLETIREATEEEYQDAIVRDAARNAIKSVVTDDLPEPKSNIVTMILNSSESVRDNEDTYPEESHVQETRCVLPTMSRSKQNDAKNTLKKPSYALRDILRLPKKSSITQFDKNLLNSDNNVEASDRHQSFWDNNERKNENLSKSQESRTGPSFDNFNNINSNRDAVSLSKIKQKFDSLGKSIQNRLQNNELQKFNDNLKEKPLDNSFQEKYNNVKNMQDFPENSVDNNNIKQTKKGNENQKLFIHDLNVIPKLRKNIENLGKVFKVQPSKDENSKSSTREADSNFAPSNLIEKVTNFKKSESEQDDLSGSEEKSKEGTENNKQRDDDVCKEKNNHNIGELKAKIPFMKNQQSLTDIQPKKNSDQSVNPIAKSNSPETKLKEVTSNNKLNKMKSNKINLNKFDNLLRFSTKKPEKSILKYNDNTDSIFSSSNLNERLFNEDNDRLSKSSALEGRKVITNENQRKTMTNDFKESDSTSSETLNIQDGNNFDDCFVSDSEHKKKSVSTPSRIQTDSGNVNENKNTDEYKNPISTTDLQNMSDSLLKLENILETSSTKPTTDFASNKFNLIAKSNPEELNVNGDKVADPCIFPNSRSDNNDMRSDASEQVVQKVPRRKSVESARPNGIISQPPLLGGLNLLKAPMPNLNDVLNLNTNIPPMPTLDDIRNRISNLFNLNEREQSEESKPFELFEKEASTPKERFVLPPLRKTKDLNFDIFQFKPLSTGKLEDSKIPNFNLNRYRAKLPVPETLKFKPLQLESTLRDKGGILGATLSYGSEKIKQARNSALSDSNHKNRLQNVFDQIPQNNLMKKISPENIHNLPLSIFERNTNPRLNSMVDIIDNIRSKNENNIRDLNHNLAKTSQKPINIQSEIKENINENLRKMHDNLKERLSPIQSRDSSNISPIQVRKFPTIFKSSSKPKTSQQRITSAASNQIPKSLRASNNGPVTLKENKTPTKKLRDSGNSFKDRQTKKNNLKKIINTSKPQSKVTISFTTTSSKPPTVGSSNIKPSHSGSLRQKDYSRPSSTFSTKPQTKDNILSKVNHFDSRTMPSELVSSRMAAPESSKFKNAQPLSDVSSRSNKIKWPKSLDHSFLSKVKDAVRSRLSNVNNKQALRQTKNLSTISDTNLKKQSDMYPAASENTAISKMENNHLKENTSYKCKMICTKE